MNNGTKMILKAIPAGLLALAAAGCSGAATRPTAAPQEDAATATATPARELTDATCAEYLDLVEDVQAEAKSTQSPAPRDAQDDLVSVMLWLHGYLSGRNGIDNQARPLTREWLAGKVGALAKACALDEDRRVVDVVTGMQ